MGIKLGNFIKDTNNVFTKEEAEMIYLSAGYADGVCISNEEYYPPTIYLDKGETTRKALEGEE